MKKVLLLTKYTYLLSFLSLALLISGCKKEEETPRPTESLVDLITATEGLDSLSRILGDFTGLQTRLASGEYTVFAPNNSAFSKLLQSIGLESMDDLDPGLVTDILLYHVIANDVLNANQLDSAATTLNVEQLTFTQGDSVVINQDKQSTKTVIISPNLQAANGVVHVINEILLPSSLRNVQSYFGSVIGITSTYHFSANPNLGGFGTINSVFSQTNLLPTLGGAGPFTLLAPLDYYFNFYYSNSVELSRLANYHILEGNINLAEADRMVNTKAGEPVYVTNDDNTIYLNGVFAGDFGLEANNGHILVLGGVLKPAEPLSDIITNAEVQTGETFTIFRTALKETNITLGEGKTIFIPTDKAFEVAGLITSIDSAAIDSVARVDPAYLTNILQTHVISTVNFSTDIVAAGTVQADALNQTPLTLTFNESTTGGGTLTVGSAKTTDAQLIYFDELSDNGVVHVINKVLLP